MTCDLLTSDPTRTGELHVLPAMEVAADRQRLLVPVLAPPRHRHRDHGSRRAPRPAPTSPCSSPPPARPSRAAATLTAPPVQHDVQLYGPGDVVGVDPRAVVRTDPRSWITNFDPNYLVSDRVLRRGLPLALQPRRARPGHRPACGPGWRSSC